MKKVLVFSAAAILMGGVIMSCGKKAEAVDAIDSLADSVEVLDTLAADSVVALDSDTIAAPVVEEAKAEVKKAVKKTATKAKQEVKAAAEQKVEEAKEEVKEEVKSELEQLQEEVAAATSPVKKQKVMKKIENSTLTPVQKQKLLNSLK